MGAVFESGFAGDAAFGSAAADGEERVDVEGAVGSIAFGFGAFGFGVGGGCAEVVEDVVEVVGIVSRSVEGAGGFVEVFEEFGEGVVIVGG